MANESSDVIIATGYVEELGGGAYRSYIDGPVSITRQATGGFTLHTDTDHQREIQRTALQVQANGASLGLTVDVGPSAQPAPALYAIVFLEADGVTPIDPVSFSFILASISEGIDPVDF